MKNKEMYLINPGNTFERVRKWYTKHKMLISGILLCVIGIIACIVFPEDAMGGVFCVMLGIPTLISGIAEMLFYRKHSSFRDNYVAYREKMQKTA